MGRINIAAIRRRQIVDAAIRVMAEKGWNETSIDEITREAGVSRGLVSYHFKDKADLLSGVLERCSEANRDVVTEAIETATDPIQRMRVIIRATLQLTRDDPAIYEIFLHFMASGRSNPELGEKIRAQYRGFRAGTAQAIRIAQSQGVFRTDIDADAAAAQYIGTLTGFAFQWLLDPESFPFEAGAQQTEDMIIEWLQNGPREAAPDPDRAEEAVTA